MLIKKNQGNNIYWEKNKENKGGKKRRIRRSRRRSNYVSYRK
jgi:hypothetical protein